MMDVLCSGLILSPWQQFKDPTYKYLVFYSLVPFHKELLIRLYFAHILNRLFFHRNFAKRRLEVKREFFCHFLKNVCYIFGIKNMKKKFSIMYILYYRILESPMPPLLLIQILDNFFYFSFAAYRKPLTKWTWTEMVN